MKLLIKSLLRESLLNEKLTDIDDDVDLIYIKYFEYDVNELVNTGIIRDDMFLQTETSTSILTTKDSIRANELNPCLIKINSGSNYYQPSTNILSISINNHAMNYVKDDHNGNFKESIRTLDSDTQRISLSNEFTPEKIKGSIHHELAHWLDDTFNNQHIKKRLDKSMETGTRDLGGIPVNATKMEIQGQIHNVKQLHNKYSDRWDDITFEDLLKYSPPLTSIFNNLKGEVRHKWLRDLKTRMAREGLLGKKMY